MAEPVRKQDQADAGSAPGDDNITELPRTHRRKRRWLRGLLRFALMIMLPAMLLIYGASLWAESLRYITTENAYVKADLVAVSADVTGRVIEVEVSDNQPVTRGTVLFRLDPKSFELAVRSALAEVDRVRQEIETKKADYRAGVTAIEELRENVAYLEREHQRAQALAQRGVGTTARLDEAAHELQRAQKQIITQQDRNRAILADIGGRLNIPLEEQPRYQKALAALDTAQLDLDRTIVRAPADGVVSAVKLQLGEYVEDGTPVFALVEAHDIWIEANLKETQLTHVVVGQTATLVADAFPDVTYEARIDSISPATGAEFALLPPQNASGNWVKVVQRIPVKLRLAEVSEDKPKLRVGMTVSVNIDTQRSQSLRTIVAGFLEDIGMINWLPGSLAGWLQEKA